MTRRPRGTPSPADDAMRYDCGCVTVAGQLVARCTKHLRRGPPPSTDTRRTWRVRDEHVEALEWLRQRLGLDTEAEAIRALLDALGTVRDGIDARSPAGRTKRPS